MTQQTNINIRTDINTKKNANKVFDELGMNMSTAINVFLKKCIKVNGIPFEMSNELNSETIQVINDSLNNKDIYGTFDSVEECMKALMK